jgi:carbohydrate diacid regulator
MTAQFERVARAVTERTAELLGAHVSVSDERGVVVASSLVEQVGRPFEHDGRLEAGDYLRVPLTLENHKGEVIVGEPLTGEVISPRLAQVLVELMIKQTAGANRPPNQRELKDEFIHDLLTGLLNDEAAILREAKILGLDFAPPRAVILIDASDYILQSEESGRRESADARIRRRAQRVIGSVVSFFELKNDTICAYIGDGAVAVLKASNTRNLVTWADFGDDSSTSWANLTALRRAAEDLLERVSDDTGAAITIAIGRYHPGITGLARSYQDARAALSLGSRFQGSNRVHCLDGLGIAAFVGVADERTKIDLATYLLSPLDNDRELLATLDTFFTENCCPSTTASRLSIHRNTLKYRLDKIASLTGLDPRHFDDAVQIRLAFVLRSLRSLAK